MGSKLRESKLFFWTVEIILILVGLALFTNISYLFAPLLQMGSAVLIPIVISGFLYYMFNPCVVFLEMYRIPRIAGFLICFTIAVILIVLAFMNVMPQISAQFADLSHSLPDIGKAVEKQIADLNDIAFLKQINIEEQLEKANLSISNLVNLAFVSVTNSLSKTASAMVQFFILLFTVPFILFFMFKDGHKFLGALSQFFPQGIRKELAQTVREMNQTLSTYISSTILDAIIIGVLTFISLTILGQPSALLLAVFCGITNIIPYVGPFIGAVPVAFVGLLVSPAQMLYATVAILIIQQLDGNLIKPLIMGKSLNVHPLTIILVLIGVGRIGGILGILVCIPVYVVLKTLVINIRKIYLMRRGVLDTAPPNAKKTKKV